MYYYYLNKISSPIFINENYAALIYFVAMTYVCLLTKTELAAEDEDQLLLVSHCYVENLNPLYQP